MEFHFENDSPVYLQLAGILETMVINGRYAPGDRLPSVRELALASKTNPNTVSKALAELEKKGLIETRRTAGKFVCEKPELLEKERSEKARSLCSDFIRQMNELGFKQEQITFLLEKEYENAAGNKKSE